MSKLYLRILAYTCSVILSMTAIRIELQAIPAYRGQVSVTQPDGTILTIRIHGDEYLHWITCGDRLITLGDDGFYHYASFTEEGSSLPFGERVTFTAANVTAGTAKEAVTPPKTAIQKALRLRSLNASSVSTKSAVTTGSKHFLVLLIEYSDQEFTTANPRYAFKNMLNASGYKENGATGSVKDYFTDQSCGVFNPTFDVIGPIKVSRDAAYYCGSNYGIPPNTPNARTLLTEACDSLVKNRALYGFTSFADYDLNGDGAVENVYFFYAGYNSAEGGANAIWPHSYSGTIGTYDGCTIANYACTSEYKGSTGEEMASIGPFCHEFGHVLGLPDFYNTDYDSSEEYADGLWNYSLMCDGFYNNSSRTPPNFNCEERILVGWMDRSDLPELTATGTYSLDPVRGNIGYVSPTENNGEYYYYEFRNGYGWDEYVTPGLLIYHVDKSSNDVHGMSAAARWATHKGINNYADHQCFDLVEAYPSLSGIPYGNSVFSFNAHTSPAALDWKGQPTGFNLKNISYNYDRASFYLDIDKGSSLSGTVRDAEGSPVSGAVVTIAVVENSNNVVSPSTGGRVLSLYAPSESSPSFSTISSSDGTYHIEAENIRGEDVMLTVSDNRYRSYSALIDNLLGPVEQDIVLHRIGEPYDYELYKYNNDARALFGTGTPKDGYHYVCCIQYEPDELESYIGGTLQYISYQVFSSSIEEFGVVAYVGDQEVMRRKLDNPVFGPQQYIDVSDEGIVIPEGESFRVGYWFYNSDYPHPMMVDKGPYVNGGCEISMDDGQTWRPITDYNLSLNYIISASIRMSSEDPLYELGMHSIRVTSTGWKAGDTFTFSLNESKTQPESIEWFFDGEVVTEPAITLTSGHHTVKARARFGQDHIENIIYEMNVL